MAPHKTTIHTLYQKKYQQDKKIVMLTAYDAWSAAIIDQTPVDMILVGDSAAMVCHGFENTTFATIDMMVSHTQAVSRANPHQLIVADLPFLSYRQSLSKSMMAVDQLIKAGADAVKLEGVTGNEPLIAHLVSSGIPVMGHIGLTPQHINQLGGFRVQGREPQQKIVLLKQAKQLESLGCFSVVVECVPFLLGKKISKESNIPIIGIGAGPETDGQVLVLHDLLGLSGFKPQFVAEYLSGQSLMKDAITQFCTDVSTLHYPASEHCYHD